MPLFLIFETSIFLDTFISRYANIVLKKADIPLSKRAGELTEDDTEKLITIMQNPRQYKIPDWFLNRNRDIKDGKTNQVRMVTAN